MGYLSARWPPGTFSGLSPPTLWTIVTSVLLLALITYGLQRRAATQAPIILVPTWAPIEMALVAAVVGTNGVAADVLRTVRRFSGSLFGVTMKHQALLGLPGVDRLLARSTSIIDGNPTAKTTAFRIFGCSKKAVDLFDNLEATHAAVQFVERHSVNDAAATASLQQREIPQRVSSMVSLPSERQELQVWEKTAEPRTLGKTVAGAEEAVEVDLEKLLRDFGACIAIPALFGNDLLERNESLLEDFWKFDNHAFTLLLLGAPLWAPIKTFQEGITARKRLHAALAVHSSCVEQYRKGEPVDFDADMTDVSAVILGRNQIFAEHGLSARERGQMELGLLWGQNANTQPLLFWFSFYIYSTPGLVDQLRLEVDKHVEGSVDRSWLRSVDFAALSRDCPLFKSAFFETLRLVNDAASIRYLRQPLAIPDGDVNHELKAGSWISVPHFANQRDASLYSEPHLFKPDRFLETDPDTNTQTPRYGKMRPWGAGVGICKGRTFAEKEILGVMACIVTAWDLRPASGKWQDPGMVPGTAVKRPAKAIRAVFSRRKMM